MILTEIDHVAIAVHDLEAAIEYYADAFGAEVEHRETVESDGVEEALIKVADSYIQLITPTRDDSPIAKFLEQRGPGMHHVCFQTDDVHSDDGKLREAGMQVLREEPSPGAGGATVQFVHPRSSGGVLVELSQPNPGGHE